MTLASIPPLIRSGRFALAIVWVAAFATPAAAAQRIISTDAFVTELLFSLDAQDQLIAIDVTSKLPDTYARDLPNVGYHRNLSAEGLLSLEPTLVIGSQHMGPPPVIKALSSANIQLLQLPVAHSPSALKDNIRKTAKAVGMPRQGEAVSTRLNQQLSILKDIELAHERIAFLLAMAPGKLRLAGDDTSGQAFIELLGATNVASFENYRNVSEESLMTLNPSMIIIAGSASDDDPANPTIAWNLLNYSEAVKHDKVFHIDGGSLVAGLSLSSVQEALRIAHAAGNRPSTTVSTARAGLKTSGTQRDSDLDRQQ